MGSLEGSHAPTCGVRGIVSFSILRWGESGRNRRLGSHRSGGPAEKPSLVQQGALAMLQQFVSQSLSKLTGNLVAVGGVEEGLEDDLGGQHVTPGFALVSIQSGRL